ncbi:MULTISPECIES: hypothetical protein [Stenotrophomonas]|uniref:hypothetical protein n=1 Tax=Stenotrophomonas sp. CC22-02 TaxID=1378087 RepID=UPI0010639467|nr:hypothetical protein [Stenotrophomonas sp. CC22-02]MBN5172089.1 hypothetical protein [Stenotrophomonas maltophilia]TDV29697.1 hypothetical protein N440_0495 [Stenotrophomonas sp. CC22-02]HEL3779043.1 hypothetical protein [Stenotrophomonas maltophilia]HEL3782056.1 hypothetical protein [Stenotrophomonas maltophilia]HEL5005309.1 hypothetical protein [Stenotrophomonas maltophilia]
MASGYRSGGTDFDDLFDPYVEGPLAQDSGRRVGGTDLSRRYAHIQYGSKRADVGHRIGGMDVSNLWAARGTAQYDAVTIPNPSIGGSSYAGAAPNGHAAFSFKSNGMVQTWTNNPNGVTRTFGPWLIRGIASNFEIRYTKVEGNANPSGTGAWLNLGTDRYCGFDVVYGSAGCSLIVEIRRASTGVVLAREDQVYMSASHSRGDTGPIME